MHIGRILALVGALFAVLGLALTVLIMDGMDALPELSQAVPGVPDGIPTIFGGLDTWAKVVVVVLLAVVVVLAVRPRTRQPQDRVSAGITTLVGVAFFVYAVIKLLETGDESLALMEVFDQLGEVGARPAALDGSIVAPGFGFLIIMVGTALVATGGVFGLIGVGVITSVRNGTPTLLHTQKYCVVKDKPIGRSRQTIYGVAGQPCPHCGVPLPAKGGQVPVQVGEDGGVIATEPETRPPFWKRPTFIVPAVVLGVLATYSYIATSLANQR